MKKLLMKIFDKTIGRFMRYIEKKLSEILFDDPEA